MRELQRLIKEILILLASRDLTDQEQRRELAGEYTEQCRLFNLKAEECRRMLERKMFVEANQYAESLTPSLFRMDQLLNFPERERFLELYQMYDWPPPPHLQSDVIRRLRSMSSEMKDLTPLLNAYRQIARSNDVQSKILLLRQIVKRDHNPEWLDALNALEKEFLEILTHQAKDAIIHGDFDALEKIRETLFAPDWSVPPSEVVRKKITNVLEEHARKERERICGKLFQSLKEAYAGKQDAPLEHALRELDFFLLSEEYEPEESVLEQLREIRAFREERKRIREENAEYESLVKRLEEGIAGNAALPGLEDLFRCVEEMGKKVPDALLTQFLEYRERTAAAARGKLRLRIGGAAAGGVAVLLLLIISAVLIVRNATEREWTRRLEKSLAENSGEASLKLLQSFEKESPALCRGSNITRLAEQIRKKKELEDVSRKRFAALIPKMRAALQNYEKNRNLLLEDNALALRLIVDQQEENIYREFKEEFRRKKNEYADRQKQRYLLLLERLQEQRKGFFAALDGEDPAKAESCIRKAEELKEQMICLQEVPTDVKSNGMRILEEIPELKSTLSRKQSYLETRRALFGDLDDPQNLAYLKEKINLFLSGFQEHPKAAVYRKLLEDHILPAERFLKLDPENPGDGTLYSADAAELKKMRAGRQKLYSGMSSKFDEMAAIDRRNPLYALILKTEDGSWIDLYYNDKGAVENLGKTVVGENVFRAFRVECLADTRGTTSQVLIQYNEQNRKGSIENKRYQGTFVYPDHLEGKRLNKVPAPHVQMIDRIAKELKTRGNENNICEMVTTLFRENLSSEQINPYLRLLIAEILVNTFSAHLPENASYAEMKKRISYLKKKLTASYHWIRGYEEHSAEQNQLRRDLQELKLLPLTVSGDRFREHLLRIALSRRLVPAGYLMKENGTSRFIRLNSAPTAGELWLLSHEKCVVVGSYRLKEFQLHPGAKAELPENPVFYTPEDGRSTPELMNELRKEARTYQIADFRWPVCWPEFAGDRK